MKATAVIERSNWLRYQGWITKNLPALGFGTLFYYFLNVGPSAQNDAAAQAIPLFVIVTLFTVWLLVRKYNRWQWYQTPLDRWLLVWLAVAVFSMVANKEQIGRSSVWTWYIALSVAVWFLVVDVVANGAVQRRTIINGVLLAGIGVMISVGGQAYALSKWDIRLPPTTPIRWFARAGILPDWSAFAVDGVYGFAPTSWINDHFRLSGNFSNPNNLSAVLAMLIPILASYLLHSKPRWLRILLAVYLVLVGLALIGTLSLNGWESTVVGSGLLFMLLRGFSARRLAVVVAISLLALTGLIFLRRNDERIGLYSVAIQALLERPLTGYGPFDYQVRERYSYRYGVNSGDFFYYSTHNIVFQTGAELGIPGLLVLGILILVAIRAMFNPQHIALEDRFLSAGASAALIVLLAHSMLDNVLIYNGGMGLLVIALLMTVGLPKTVWPPRRTWLTGGIIVLWMGLLLIAVWNGGANAIYWTSFGDPARKLVYTFDSASDHYLISGEWNQPENDPAGNPFRWTAAKDVTLAVSIPLDVDMTVQFRIDQAAAPDIEDSLRLTVNGDPITLAQRSDLAGQVTYSGIVAQSTLAKSNPQTRLIFHTNRVKPPDVYDALGDMRTRGLAFSWLRIQPQRLAVNAISLPFAGCIDPFVLGDGWYGPETLADGTPFQWSRTTTFSLTPYLMTNADLEIGFRVIRAISPDILEGLTLDVNGDPVELQALPDPDGGVDFMGRLPQSSLAKSTGLTQLTFHTLRVLSPSALGQPDTRTLGIAFSWLRIDPVSQGQYTSSMFRRNSTTITCSN